MSSIIPGNLVKSLGGLMKQTETLEVSRLRGATIFKLIILGSVVGCTLITTIFGVAGIFGVEAIQWNGQYLTGLKGLFASPFIGAFIGVIFGMVTAVSTYVGLRVFSLFRGISIEYVPVGQQPSPATEDVIV